MYQIFNCPCCGSSSTTKKSAQLSRFVYWRITGQDPGSNTANQLITCDHCEFRFSAVRYHQHEEAVLYLNYRQDEYNRLRNICEPEYLVKSQQFDQHEHNRKLFMQQMTKKNLPDQEYVNIATVLDYGGADGHYIVDCFEHAEKYVYDLSCINLLPGIRPLNRQSQNKFDMILCCQVLEHQSDLKQILDDITSLAGNWIYIEVPYYTKPPPDNVVIGEHVNFFNATALTILLEKFGIQSIEVVHEKNLQLLAVLGKKIN